MSREELYAEVKFAAKVWKYYGRLAGLERKCGNHRAAEMCDMVAARWEERFDDLFEYWYEG